VLRLETAWRTASSLANTAGLVDDVAQLLLDQAQMTTRVDQLRDTAIARALQDLEWDKVGHDLRERWKARVLQGSELLPITAEVISSRLGVMPPRSAGASLSLEAMATELNAAMRGIPFNQDLVPGAVRLVRDSLSQIRRSASQGAYSMGAIAAADVAAGLILHAGAQELWTDLPEFLTDPAVQRDDRSPAFERLAPDASEIPRDARERFKSAAQSWKPPIGSLKPD
jgi:hypothetical protein